MKIKRPIEEKKAQYRLFKKLGIIGKANDKVDEEAMDRCLEILKESFPPSLIVAMLCGSAKVKGPNGELWNISASEAVS